MAEGTQKYEWRHPEKVTITKQSPPEAPKEGEVRNSYGHHITKTYLYIFLPPKTPLLYSKTGFTRHTFFFLFLLKNLSESVLTSTHNLCFEQKCENVRIFICKLFFFFFFFWWFQYIRIGVVVMTNAKHKTKDAQRRNATKEPPWNCQWKNY